MNENLVDIIKAIVWGAVFVIWFLITLWKKLRQNKSAPPLPEVSARGDSQDTKKDKKRKIPVRQIFGSLKGDLEDFFEDIVKVQKGEQQRPLPGKSEPTREDIASVTHRPDICADISKDIESFQTHVSESQKRASCSPFCLKLSKRDLRQAVVYSEILGPPIALRENNKTF